MYCKFCGVELPDDVKFCTECGKQVKNADATQNDATQKMETTATSVLDTVDQTQGLQETQEISRSQESQIAQDSQQIQESSEKKRKISPVLLTVIIAVVVFLVLLFVFIAVDPLGIGSSQDGGSGSEGIEQSEGSGADQGSQGESTSDSAASDEGTDNDDTSNEGENSVGESESNEDEVTDENEEESQDETNNSARGDDSESGDAEGSLSVGGVFEGESEARTVNASEDGADYILPDCSTDYYTKEELESLNDYDLYLARNEIFARYGRGFDKDDLNDYFNSKGWYTQRYESGQFENTYKGDEPLNGYENANVGLIQEIEAERNSPYKD